jgi:hypothetical protein
MVQAVRRLAWLSSEVEQAEKPAPVWQTGSVSCRSASLRGLGG